MLVLLALAPAWIPVFIVQQRVDAVDVWAPNPAAATNLVALWSTNAAGPSEEFPFRGEVDTRTTGAPLYPPSTRPFVRLTDRRTIGGCWYATASPPSHSPQFHVPSLDAWRRLASNAPKAIDPEKHLGLQVDMDVRSVNLDAPDYKPTWNPYRRYIVVESPHVWYYPAVSPDQAVKQARAEWIDGGVYALGRRLRYQEASDLARLPALRQKLPARPWAALMASRCEPLRVRDRLPGCWETVRSDLPPQRPPYDVRTIGAGGVPFFATGL